MLKNVFSDNILTESFQCSEFCVLFFLISLENVWAWPRGLNWGYRLMTEVNCQEQAGRCVRGVAGNNSVL